MNRILFRLTSLGLLLFAWAWVTLALIPSHVAKSKQLSDEFSKRARELDAQLDEVVGALYDLNLYSMEPERLAILRELGKNKCDYLIERSSHLWHQSTEALPDQRIDRVADNAGWVFAAGLFVFAWCSFLAVKLKPHSIILPIWPKRGAANAGKLRPTEIQQTSVIETKTVARVVT